MILRKYPVKYIVKDMKCFLIIFIFFLNLVSWSKEIYFKNLFQKDDIFYEKFSGVPFTGKSIGQLEGVFKNGMKHGEFIKYYSDDKK